MMSIVNAWARHVVAFWEGTIPRIVIVGAGFGGLACAKALGKPAQVTIVDRRNFHLFSAAALPGRHRRLSPADIAQPIRRILGALQEHRRHAGRSRRRGFFAPQSEVARRRALPYDRLVIAAGSRIFLFRP